MGHKIIAISAVQHCSTNLGEYSSSEPVAIMTIMSCLTRSIPVYGLWARLAPSRFGNNRNFPSQPLKHLYAVSLWFYGFLLFQHLPDNCFKMGQSEASQGWDRNGVLKMEIALGYHVLRQEVTQLWIKDNMQWVKKTALFKFTVLKDI